MKLRLFISALFLSLVATSCGWNLNAPDDNGDTDPDDETAFKNVMEQNLPAGLGMQSNAVKAVDIDNDEDLDLVIAISLEANKVLVNNGEGVFSDETSSRLTTQNFDTQDLVTADFNTDGNPDLFFTSKQNQSSELFLNNSSGTFNDVSNRIPVTGNYTSSTALDVDEDGDMDLLIGNRGQNVILANNGNAFLNNQTSERLPQINDNTYDVSHTDITGNGLVDLIIANEGPNLTLINTSSGIFANQSADRLPYINAAEESHSIAVGDVDGDDDTDIYFGNTGFNEDANPQDRLLINDGQGFFSDQTADRLPEISTNTSEAQFADINDDGDLDLVIGNYNGGLRILINNGSGFFSDESEDWLPEDFSPFANAIEVADFNADGLLDIYIAVHNEQDQLLIQQETN